MKSTESSQPEKLRRVNASTTRKPLTDKQKKELSALAGKPDSLIDLSDIPEVFGPDYERTKKKAISIRIDSDVLAWLQTKPGYQSRINSLLRQAYLRSRE